ncbi:MAG: hypothetical protein AAFX99_35815, partial [Myxococcota bacterium]
EDWTIVANCGSLPEAHLYRDLLQSSLVVWVMLSSCLLAASASCVRSRRWRKSVLTEAQDSRWSYVAFPWIQRVRWG